MLRIVALMFVYNEQVHLCRTLAHLVSQGLHVYIVNNGSTDRTREIALSYLGHGVVGVEDFPRNDFVELEVLLRRIEAITAEIDADWFHLGAADEIPQPPQPWATLQDAIVAVDQQGYNAINYDEFVFAPTSSAENYEHDRFVEEMEYYFFYKPPEYTLIRTWKNLGLPPDLHSSGSHHAKFPDQKLYPHAFILRHYMVLSLDHMIRKYCHRRYSPRGVARGWHFPRPYVQPKGIRFPDRSRLKHLDASNPSWDRSDPMTVYPFFEAAARRRPIILLQTIKHSWRWKLTRPLRMIYDGVAQIIQAFLSR